MRWPVSEGVASCTLQSWGHDLGITGNHTKRSNERATDTRSPYCDRAIACLRKAIEELAAERPREARAMVVNAAGSVAALREMIEGQILKQPGMVK